jgi:hypothetical protein
LCPGAAALARHGRSPNISPNIGSRVCGAMSVQARKRARGRVVFEVIWREPDGRQGCETFSTRREAEGRDREIRDLRDRSRHEAIDAGSESLAEATERWWVDHVESSVSQSTANVYASALDLHLIPRMARCRSAISNPGTSSPCSASCARTALAPR